MDILQSKAKLYFSVLKHINYGEGLHPEFNVNAGGEVEVLERIYSFIGWLNDIHQTRVVATRTRENVFCG
ncbi:MAG: hypothetical protein Q8Q15_00170 [bacterium]|nr:hypothetical protein [bacterium]